MVRIKDNEYYTVKEISDKIGVSLGTVYYWIKTNRFKKAVINKGQKFLEKKEADLFLKEYTSVKTIN